MAELSDAVQQRLITVTYSGSRRAFNQSDSWARADEIPANQTAGSKVTVPIGAEPAGGNRGTQKEKHNKWF